MWFGKQIKCCTKPDAQKQMQVYGQRLIDWAHLKLSQGVQYEQMQGFNENAHSKALASL